MITIHHLHHSRSQRIPWLLEELGVGYEIIDHGRINGLAPAALREVHPLGKAPVIVDQGRVVAESGAIIEYVLGRHGNGRLGPPGDQHGRLAWTYWMHYAEGSLMPLVVMRMIFDRMQRTRWPASLMVRAVLKPVRNVYLAPNVERHLQWIESSLDGQAWFAGERFSAADIQMSVPLLALVAPDDAGATGWPNIRRFLARVSQREAYQRAAARIRESQEQGGQHAA